MDRRRFLTHSLLAAGSALPLARAIAETSPSLTSLHIDANEQIGPVSPDFVGLGYEISSVPVPGLLSVSNQTYVQLVRTLGTNGVLRIGGNTSDYSHYAPAAPVVSSPKGTIVNDAVLRDLVSFLKATGWKLIWGLNLGSGSVEEAVAEAAAILAIAADHILAFEIGNEPDLFPHEKHRPPDYSYDAWLADYRRYKTALRSRFPHLPFAGPDVAGHTDWVTRFAQDEGRDIVLLTHHYYREGQNPSSTIQKLLNPDPKLQPQLDQLRAASRIAGVPYRICEVNSFSGGGRPGVSDTMASALWVLDYMFTLAANGCSGVNMETGVNQLGFISPYSPIAPAANEQAGPVTAKPEYYGMLAFSLAAQGTLLKVDQPADAPLAKAYATRRPDGKMNVTLINKGSDPVTFFITLDGAPHQQHATLLRLTGPAIDAKTGIMLGGSAISAAGAWKPVHSEAIPIASQKLTLTTPAASAAIATIS